MQLRGDNGMYELGLMLGQGDQPEDGIYQAAGFGQGLGTAQEAYRTSRQRRALDLEENARTVEDRRKALADEQATAESDRLQLEELKGRELKDLLDQGPPEQSAVQRIQDHFAQVSNMVSRMQPQHREQRLLEERARLQEQAVDRARKQVGEGLQERLRRGAFTFVDENEPDAEVQSRIELLQHALDGKQADPLEVAKQEADLLGVVRKENQRRLGRQRVDANIDRQIGLARDMGNNPLAGQLDQIKAMWDTGELSADDVTDKLFELQTGRKTARAAGPTPFDVRKEALKLWGTYEEGPPTEEGLRKYVLMLTAPDIAPLPVKQPAAPAPTKDEAAAAPAPRTWDKVEPKARMGFERDLVQTLLRGGVTAEDRKKAVVALAKQYGIQNLPRDLLERAKAQAQLMGEKPVGELSNQEAGMMP